MSVPTFYVGELPTTPLVIELTGVPVDLTTYALIELSGDELPAGDVTVLSAEDHTIQYEQDDPWETAGVYEVQAKLTRADGRVDYSDIFEIAVKGERVDSYITPEQAWDLTGQAVSSRELADAQSFLSLVLGRDIASATWRATLSAADLNRVTQAVAWQAAYEQPEEPIAPLNARRIRAGDVEISFDRGGPVKGLLIAPMAGLALRSLSWRNSKTIHATPFLGYGVRDLVPPYDYTWPQVTYPPGGVW